MDFRTLIQIDGRWSSRISLACMLSLLAVLTSACPAVTPTEEQSKIAAVGEIPPGFMTVLQSEPPSEQRKFLDLPKERQQEIIAAWKQRLDLMQTFSPAERVIISSLSTDDSDKFFDLTDRSQQQSFLADRVKTQINDWIACRTETHRNTD